MQTDSIELHLKKKKVLLTPNCMTVYRQSKVVEAIDPEMNHYYLVFYKDSFLAAVKKNAISIYSHVYSAFSKGIQFKGNHPLTRELLKQHNSYSFSGFNHLLKKVQDSYSLLETAFIFTLFDSFVSPEKIRALLKKIYYQYKRNGQLFASYQLLHIHLQFDPHDSFAQDMIRNMQYQRYEEIYQDPNKLLTKDPMHLESICFDGLNDKENLSMLLKLCQQQKRYTDELAIRIHLLSIEHIPENIAKIQQHIEAYNKDEQLLLLKELATKAKDTDGIQAMILDHLLFSNDHNDTVFFTMTTNYQPKKEHLDGFIQSIDHADSSVLASVFQQSNKRLIQLFQHDLKTLEKLIHTFITSFLNHYSIEAVLEWFRPFHTKNIQLPIEQKIKKMHQLENDPDHQQELGDLYLYFNQFEKSIDCFKWEMELNDKDIRPIKQLIKVFKKLDYKEELSTYQFLLLQIQKS